VNLREPERERVDEQTGEKNRNQKRKQKKLKTGLCGEISFTKRHLHDRRVDGRTLVNL
jgi:hypothetical protein